MFLPLVVYSQYKMMMKPNPFSKVPSSTISYQSEEESIPVGCCFSNMRTQPPSSQNAPTRYRVCSEPKEARSKKIDLVIAKRRMSSSKETNSCSHRMSNIEVVKQTIKSQYRDGSNIKLGITLGSKLTSQRASMKVSKVSFNKDMKIEGPVPEVKQSCMTSRNTTATKPLYTEASRNQGNEQQTSIAFISEISFVEEEFISHGSQTLQALNFIAQFKQNKNREKHCQVRSERQSPEKLRRLQPEEQPTNPFSKRLDRRVVNRIRKQLVL